MNVRLATQSWGEGEVEKKREILYYHPTTSKLGKKEWNSLKQQLAMTTVPPAHLLVVTRGWGRGEGWGEESSGLR